MRFDFGAMAGGVLLLIVLGAALFAPWLSPGDPLAIVARPLTLPFQDAHHPLGTDRLGRDLLAGVIHGARTSVIVGLSAAIVAIAAGMLVGTIAGFAGGWVEAVLMRVVEAFQIVPGFLLALAFVAVSGPSLGMLVLAIAIGAWTSPARLARARVLALKQADFVAAARVIGMHPAEIALRQIMPLALPPVLALTAVIVAGAILTESALSFLGLGDPNVVTWGGMIAEGRNQLRAAPWLSIIPGLALVVTVIATYLLGEAISDRVTGKVRR
ncbi:ABC transporter permease [Ketogulonicigenium vulgare]|uniref:Putative peptide ABC transporter permease protein, oppC-like protein n=1 Tax=Ketogulonicigenium vulgare (strain WSH-001) TaxID=759362 RepID=F9Y5Z8_KETVW|nr:ABC transporter permease [Ketogulonicigenium vulgare]ADO42631.1 peptide ABC transporter, permease protein [Ketogulonicigenium vulgare Y25]AEM40823.1 putative peptide ABC transporter permease protein, oppC-like protein [Ketogulonicigenium vulgare WSH-001]ALJ80988.1 peptide ABC transporter permease [Ketogulonicigenium vulgare]ANW33753.1 peptide ABC transporter permease [Ketogulonicigenium vulgare]AOZ54541.1 peptide ABC transporter permease [Ketogulonicigenium vulgare]